MAVIPPLTPTSPQPVSIPSRELTCCERWALLGKAVVLTIFSGIIFGLIFSQNLRNMYWEFWNKRKVTPILKDSRNETQSAINKIATDSLKLKDSQSSPAEISPPEIIKKETQPTTNQTTPNEESQIVAQSTEEENPLQEATTNVTEPTPKISLPPETILIDDILALTLGYTDSQTLDTVKKIGPQTESLVLKNEAKEKLSHFKGAANYISKLADALDAKKYSTEIITFRNLAKQSQVLETPSVTKRMPASILLIKMQDIKRELISILSTFDKDIRKKLEKTESPQPPYFKHLIQLADLRSEIKYLKKQVKPSDAYKIPQLHHRLYVEIPEQLLKYDLDVATEWGKEFYSDYDRINNHYFDICDQYLEQDKPEKALDLLKYCSTWNSYLILKCMKYHIEKKNACIWEFLKIKSATKPTKEEKEEVKQAISEAQECLTRGDFDSSIKIVKEKIAVKDPHTTSLKFPELFSEFVLETLKTLKNLQSNQKPAGSKEKTDTSKLVNFLFDLLKIVYIDMDDKNKEIILKKIAKEEPERIDNCLFVENERIVLFEHKPIICLQAAKILIKDKDFDRAFEICSNIFERPNVDPEYEHHTHLHNGLRHPCLLFGFLNFLLSQQDLPESVLLTIIRKAKNLPSKLFYLFRICVQVSDYKEVISKTLDEHFDQSGESDHIARETCNFFQQAEQMLRGKILDSDPNFNKYKNYTAINLMMNAYINEIIGDNLLDRKQHEIMKNQAKAAEVPELIKKHFKVE